MDHSPLSHSSDDFSPLWITGNERLPGEIRRRAGGRGYNCGVEAPFHYRIYPSGVVEISGPDRESYLQGQCTNDVLSLPVGGVQPAAILSPKGKIHFFFHTTKMEDRLRLLIEDGVAAPLAAHLRKFAIFTKIAVSDCSADFVRVDFAGAAPDPPPAIHAWPGSGETSSIWLVGRDTLPAVEKQLARAGTAMTSEEAEVLRVEAGRPLPGRDFDSSNLPDEAGLEAAISRTKGCYVGQEIVARIKTYGRVNRRLVRFSFDGGVLPPAGAGLSIPGEPERVVGQVTSAVRSRRFGIIGIGFAHRDVAPRDRLVVRENPAIGAVVAEAIATR